MPKLIHSVPKYMKHKASGQAFVRLSGKDYYLGPHGTKTSHVVYDRLIAEYLASGRQIIEPAKDASTSVVEVLAAYLRFAKTYYVKNGKPTNEQNAFKVVIRDTRDLYGDIQAEEFGPKALKAMVQVWLSRGLARKSINQNMGRLVRIFKWASAEEMIPVAIYQALATVPGLKLGRTTAPEPPPIMPVENNVVVKTLPHLPRIVADMVRIQLLTGARPNEVCRLRPCDVNREDEKVWEYTPSTHKTEHHGRSRIVHIGPEAQKVLTPYLLRDSKLPCFSAAEAIEEFKAKKKAARVTPLSCGNKPGSNIKEKPKLTPADQYTPDSYRRAVHRACDKAFPAPEELEGEELKQWQSDQRWSPNQLRHTKATEVRKKYGLEAAQVILGHANANVTQVYAERDREKARTIAMQIG